MMHPGKPDRIRALTLGALAMVGVALLLGEDGLAQRTNPKESVTEGFRKLRWGASVGEATGIYRDLYFDRYVITDGREEPSKVFVRRAEHGDIENVSFDSIEYWFQGDHFYQVRAILQSRIGPRTLVTPAENAFDKLSQRLTSRYGAPSDHKIDYVTEFIVVVKEATWNVDRSAITIKYEGVGRTNEDLLTLTMQEKAKR